MTRFLTIPQVLFIHARLIAETGGRAGLRDLNLLEAAVARPQAMFAGEQLYPDLFSQAAALMHSLINNHPFVAINKRVGFSAAGLFLQLNGHRFTAINAEVEIFTVATATGQHDVPHIAAWLQRHSHPI